MVLFSSSPVLLSSVLADLMMMTTMLNYMKLTKKKSAVFVVRRGYGPFHSFFFHYILSVFYFYFDSRGHRESAKRKREEEPKSDKIEKRNKNRENIMKE